MSYAGLGQASSGSSLVTLAPRSSELVSVQQRLIAAGLLRLSAPDGTISSATSPTLTAVRSFATSNGLSSTGTARSSTGGLIARRDLLDAIVGSAAPAPSVSEIVATALPGPATTPGTSPAKGGGGGATSPASEPAMEPPSGANPRTILIVAGVGVVLLAGMAVWLSRPVRANRRRRRR